MSPWMPNDLAVDQAVNDLVSSYHHVCGSSVRAKIDAHPLAIALHGLPDHEKARYFDLLVSASTAAVIGRSSGSWAHSPIDELLRSVARDLVRRWNIPSWEEVRRRCGHTLTNELLLVYCQRKQGRRESSCSPATEQEFMRVAQAMGVEFTCDLAQAAADDLPTERCFRLRT